MNRYVPVLAQSRRPTCATAAITISRSCLQNVWSPFPKPQSSIRTYPAKMSTKCSLSQQRGAVQREEELSILYVCLNWEYSSHTGISLGKGYQSSVDSDLFNGFYLNFHSNPISAVSKAAPPVDLLHFPKVAPIVSHRFQCFVALHDRSWCLSRGMKFTEAPTLNLNIKQETMSHSFRGWETLLNMFIFGKLVSFLEVFCAGQKFKGSNHPGWHQEAAPCHSSA